MLSSQPRLGYLYHPHLYFSGPRHLEFSSFLFALSQLLNIQLKDDTL